MQAMRDVDLIIEQIIRSDVAMMRAMSSMVRQRQRVGVEVNMVGSKVEV